MTLHDPSFTLGIEEELLLVDPESRNLVEDPPQDLMAELTQQLGQKVSPEYLRSQVEVGTPVCRNVKEAREQLSLLRRAVVETAARFDLAVIAASTHPMADWTKQKRTDKDRYAMLQQNLQGVLRRLLICGMHVHVGIEAEDARIDLMNQVTYFLPHIMALSTSSPFWNGQDSGLHSYRLAVFDELPRTGLPDQFTSFGEYERLVQQLVAVNAIEDGTEIWWDLRPSARYPTLEMRLCDIPTRLDDTVTVAALFQGLLSMLHRLRKQNQRWRLYPSSLIMENRWRAQRYGITGTMGDYGKAEAVPYPQLLNELIDLIEPDVAALGLEDAVENAYDILERGTSAMRQVETYNAAKEAGKSHEDCLKAVVDFLVAETKVGL